MPTDPVTPDPDPPAAELVGQIVIVVEPIPGDVPAAVRLKRLLKAMLRVYGLRCVHLGRREEREIVCVEVPARRKKRPTTTRTCDGKEGA